MARAGGGVSWTPGGRSAYQPTPARHHPHTPAAHTDRRYGAPSPAAAAMSPSSGMAAAAASRRPRCSTCGGSALRENALGYLICTDCGAQAADHMAITQEVEEEVYGNMQRVLRTGTRIKRVTAKVLQLTPQEMELVHSQLLLHGFNSLLQLQCRVLVTQFGAPPLLVGVVGRLWVSYVAQWRDASEPREDGTPRWGETHRDMVVRRYIPGANYQQHKPSADGPPATDAHSEPRTPKRPRSADDDDDDSITDFKRRRADATLADSPREHVDPEGAAPHSSRDRMQLQSGELSMSLSIVILYLACHLLRESITLQQLCTWVHLGRLPFFNVRAGFAPAIWERIQRDSRLVTFFQPQSCPSAPRLATLAHHAATAIAQQMEQLAHSQLQAGGEAAQQAQLTYQQAHQLRQLITPSGAHTVAAQDQPDGASPALSSPFNSSLLLRTWLEQLRLPSQLHPLTMEILSQVDVLAVGAPLGSKLTRAKKAAASMAAAESAQRKADRQIMLMACLVLSVQLSLGTHATSPTQSVESLVSSDEGPAVALSLASETDQSDGPALALPQYLAQVLAPTAAAAGASSSYLRSSSEMASSSSVAARSALSSIAENWSISARGWPKTVHGARTLLARDQQPFLDWMAGVCLARLAPPKDFDFYREQFEHLARTQHRHQPQHQPYDVATTTRAAEATKWNGDSATSAADSPEPPSALVSSLLACERVVSYSSNRRGYYHPVYSSLLDRCAALLGIVPAQLHAATQRAIRTLQFTHGSGSVYVNTQATPRATKGR